MLCLLRKSGDRNLIEGNSSDLITSMNYETMKPPIKWEYIWYFPLPKVKSDQITFSMQESFFNCASKLDVSWEFSQDIEYAIKGAHAIIILTEWEEYSKIKWSDKEYMLKKPVWIFDTRSIIDIEEIKKTKIKLWRLGSKSINLNSSKKD